MEWKKGITWTHGYWTETENPDKTREKIYVHSGIFIFFPNLFWKVFFYFGFRPTPTWGLSYGNEGLLPFVKKLLYKYNMSNFGIALRVNK